MKDFEDLTKAGKGYLRAKTAEIWFGLGISVIAFVLIGVLFSNLVKFLESF